MSSDGSSHSTGGGLGRRCVEALGGSWRRVTEDPLFSLTFGALLLLYALPLVLVSHPPLQDWPAHLRIVELWRSAGEATAGLNGSAHEARSWLQPYVAHHALVRGLGALMPLDLAQRLLLVLYAVSLPLSFLYLLTVAGRDRRYALFSFAFIYNAPLIFGLFPQALSLPLAVATLGLLKRYLDAPTVRREVLLSLGTLGVFFFHFSAFFSYGLAAAVIFFCHLRGLRGLRRALFTLPALAVALVWVSSTIEGEGFEPVWWSLRTNLANFHLGLVDIYRGRVDEALLLLVSVTAAVALALPREKEGPRPRARAWAFGVAGLSLFVAVFLLPAETRKPAEIWAPNLRLALPAVLLLLTALPRRLGGRRGLVLLPLVVALAAYGVHLCQTFWRSSQEARQIEAVLAKIPRDKLVLPVIYHARDGVHRGDPFLHLAELYQVRRPGFVGRELVGGPAAPVRIVRPYQAPKWFLPLTFDYRRHGAYDYFLVLWPEGPRPPSFVGAGRQVRRVIQRGRFALYRNVGPATPRSSRRR